MANKNVNRCAEQGVWSRALERVQSFTQQSRGLDWVASIDSTIVRVHQNDATLPRVTGLCRITRSPVRSRLIMRSATVVAD